MSALLGIYTLVSRIGNLPASASSSWSASAALLFDVMQSAKKLLHRLPRTRKRWPPFRSAMAREALLLLVAFACRLPSAMGGPLSVDTVLKALLASVAEMQSWSVADDVAHISLADGVAPASDGSRDSDSYDDGHATEAPTRNWSALDLARDRQPSLLVVSAIPRDNDGPLWRAPSTKASFDAWATSCSDQCASGDHTYSLVLLFRRATATMDVFEKVTKAGKLPSKVAAGIQRPTATSQLQIASSWCWRECGIAVEFVADSERDRQAPIDVAQGNRPIDRGAYINAPTTPHSKTNQPADVRFVGTPQQWRSDALLRGTHKGGKWKCGDVLLAVYVRDDLLGLSQASQSKARSQNGCLLRAVSAAIR